MRRMDFLGALVAHAIYAFSILVFLCRLSGKPDLGYWFGVPLLFTALPLGYLLVSAHAFQRAFLYYVQIELMLAFLLVEFVLDYVLRLDFRQSTWLVIPYVTLFFAGTGGMIGVASAAGRPWTVSSVFLFLAMAVLAFVQRLKLGT
jgi:hypothetical protein